MGQTLQIVMPTKVEKNLMLCVWYYGLKLFVVVVSDS